MGNWIGFVAFLLFAVFVVLIIFTNVKRILVMKKCAKEMGFAFKATATNDFLHNLSRNFVFFSGREDITSILSGTFKTIPSSNLRVDSKENPCNPAYELDNPKSTQNIPRRFSC